MKNLIKNSWKKYLEKEFEKQYFKDIESFLEQEEKAWKIIYPEEKNIFTILNLLELENIKVVIIGQDPYFKEKQAHWLAFSVPEWIKIPPSLRNIFKEIWNSITPSPSKERAGVRAWNLEYLVDQWVFLLNAILTVEKEKPASHSKIWWENFTDEIIKLISQKNENIVFLLWWAFARSKATLIDKNKHLVLETSHPSPLWSYRGFLWSNCFLEANKYLKSKWKKEINW